MIRPDQIPDEVVEAAARAAWKLKDQRLWEILKATQPNWHDEARAAIAAALNAWQTPKHRAFVGSAIDEVGGFFPAIILPLPQEVSDE